MAQRWWTTIIIASIWFIHFLGSKFDIFLDEKTEEMFTIYRIEIKKFATAKMVQMWSEWFFSKKKKISERIEFPWRGKFRLMTSNNWLFHYKEQTKDKIFFFWIFIANRSSVFVVVVVFIDWFFGDLDLIYCL